ncbi:MULTISPECIES: hypothetical protein [Calothrix]|uniref:Uncharacterized protein n=2 Tax=Calothrix TaxID=1186 RepID=A0ABR8AQH9_9CYAN|nr:MULTISPECIES: hypothetical protein [Calothrix]MBD2200842.1 hypothetical protein [Calothrix parietina FACHB-288]MBD2229022.1 hypothetical protein [Calothrix anomala FACHB-343]
MHLPNLGRKNQCDKNVFQFNNEQDKLKNLPLVGFHEDVMLIMHMRSDRSSCIEITDKTSKAIYL